jgi:hypothetical protein
MSKKRPKRKRTPSPSAQLRKAKAQLNKNKHELPFLRLFASAYPDLPAPQRDFKFHPTRKWKFDFAWPEQRVAVELHGGGGRGRHCRLTGLSSDCQKRNEAQQLGYVVLEYTVLELKDMVAVVEQVGRMMQQRMQQ